MRERSVGRPVLYSRHEDLTNLSEDLRQMRTDSASLFDENSSDGRKTPLNHHIRMSSANEIRNQIRKPSSNENRNQIKKTSSNESSSQIRKTSSHGSNSTRSRSSGSGSQIDVLKTLSSGTLKESHASILGYDPNVPNHADFRLILDSRDDSDDMSPLISLSNSSRTSSSTGGAEVAQQNKQPQEHEIIEDDSEISYKEPPEKSTPLASRTTPMNTPSISSKRKSVTFVEERNNSEDPRSILRASRYYPGENEDEKDSESKVLETFTSPQNTIENPQSNKKFESNADFDLDEKSSETSSKAGSVVGVGSITSSDTISRVLASYDGRLRVMQQAHESEIEARFDEISDLKRKKMNAEKRYAKTLKDIEQTHSIEKEKIRKIATKNHNTVIKTILSNFQKSFSEKLANANLEMVSALERIEKEKQAHTSEIMRLKHEQEEHQLRLEQELDERQEREKIAHQTDMMDLKHSFARLEEQKLEMQSELNQLKSTQHEIVISSENDPSVQNVSRRVRPSLERSGDYNINGLKEDIVQSRRSRGTVFVESPSKIHTLQKELTREELMKRHQEQLSKVREESRDKYEVLRKEMTEMSHAGVRDTVMKAAITFESEIEGMRNVAEQQIGSMRKELDAWHNDEMDAVKRENELKFMKRTEAEVMSKINNARQEIESKFSDLSHGTAEELEEAKSRAESLEAELKHMTTRADQMENAKQNLEDEVRRLRQQAMVDIETLQESYTKLEDELDEERARTKSFATNRSMDSTVELESKLKELRYLDRKMSADLREEKTRTTNLIAELNERKTTIQKLHQLNVDLEAQFQELSESYEDNTQELNQARKSVRSLQRHLEKEKSTSRQLSEQASLLEAKLKNVSFITQNAKDQQEEHKKEKFLLSRELEKEKEKSRKLTKDYETVSTSLIGTIYFLSKYGFNAI